MAIQDIIEVGDRKFAEVLPKFKALLEVVTHNLALSDVVSANFPLSEFIVTDDGDVKVRVYPELTYNLDRHLNPWKLWEPHAPLDEKWATATGDTKRGEKRIVRSVDFTIGRFLNDYLFHKDAYFYKAYKHSYCVSLIAAALTPIKLLFTKDMLEIRRVFANGPVTCMHPKSDSARTYWPNATFQPVDWYAYCPDTELVYVEQAGKLMARTIIFNRTHYGRVFSPGGDTVRDKFVEELVKLGLRPAGAGEGAANRPDLSPEDMVELKTPFSVPSVKYGVENVTPYPYTDYAVPLKVSYKDEHFMWGNEGVAIALNNHGMIRESTLSDRRCSYQGCGSRITYKGYTAEDTGLSYCCTAHIPRTHCVVYRGGVKLLMHNDTPGLIMDYFTDRRHYNLAEMGQVYPCVALDIGALEFPEDLSTHKLWSNNIPYMLHHAGQNYGISASDYLALSTSGKLDQDGATYIPTARTKIKTVLLRELVIANG